MSSPVRPAGNVNARARTRLLDFDHRLGSQDGGGVVEVAHVVGVTGIEQLHFWTRYESPN